MNTTAPADYSMVGPLTRRATEARDMAVLALAASNARIEAIEAGTAFPTVIQNVNSTVTRVFMEKHPHSSSSALEWSIHSSAVTEWETRGAPGLTSWMFMKEGVILLAEIEGGYCSINLG